MKLKEALPMTRLFLLNRRFSALFLAAAGGALALGGLVAEPAQANARDYRCGELAAQARTAADSADVSKQKVAKRFVATGDKLCEAGNGRAAAQQFRSALRTAGVAEVQPAAE